MAGPWKEKPLEGTEQKKEQSEGVRIKTELQGYCINREKRLWWFGLERQ